MKENDFIQITPNGDITYIPWENFDSNSEFVIGSLIIEVAGRPLVYSFQGTNSLNKWIHLPHINKYLNPITLPTPEQLTALLMLGYSYE